MSIPEVERLYDTQVQEFKARYNAMRSKMISMYKDHEGFRDAFKEVWENAMSIEDRRAMMKIVMKRVDENLPPPKHKATMLLGHSCPEFFHDELILGKTLTMVEFLDLLCEKKENTTTYPFHDQIKTDLKKFLSALPTSVYPQFSRHPKEAQYTWTLLWEQRVFWVCHFALNMVAEMCAQISQFTEEEGEKEKSELELAFPLGLKVTVQGLKSRADLNGKEGVVVSHVLKSGRVGVKVEGNKPLSVKPENLVKEEVVEEVEEEGKGEEGEGEGEGEVEAGIVELKDEDEDKEEEKKE